MAKSSWKYTRRAPWLDRQEQKGEHDTKILILNCISKTNAICWVAALRAVTGFSFHELADMECDFWFQKSITRVWRWPCVIWNVLEMKCFGNGHIQSLLESYCLFSIHTPLKRKSNFWGQHITILSSEEKPHQAFLAHTIRSKPKLLMLELIWAHCWAQTWELVSQGHSGSPGVDGSQIRLSLQLLFLCMLSQALKHYSSGEKLEKYQWGSRSQPQQQCRRTYWSQLWVHKKCHKGTGFPTLFVTHLFPSLTHVPAHSLCL